MSNRRTAKSQALAHEFAINELVALASSTVNAAVIAKCCEVFDELQASKVFGPYQRLMSTIKSLVSSYHNVVIMIRCNCRHTEIAYGLQLYQGLLSEEVTIGDDGQLQKVPYALQIAQQQQEVARLQEDLAYQKSCVKDIDGDVMTGRAELDQLTAELNNTREQLANYQSQCKQLHEDIGELETKSRLQAEDEINIVRRMAESIEVANEKAAEARDVAATMDQYVDEQETRRKAFMDMQHNRYLAAEEDSGKLDDLQQSLTVENQLVMLLNMRLEEFEAAILGVSVETTDRLRAAFLQEMVVLHEELAAIRRHIAQLGREELIAGVKAPLVSLAAGSGTVFQIAQNASASFDGGKTFHDLPMAEDDSLPALKDQFIQQTTFDVGRCAALASVNVGISPSPVSHIQVKLQRRHTADEGTPSTIPLSELPPSLGAGPIWQIYRRNGGQEVTPKRPKEVELAQLLRLIDEVHKCKAILEDDREDPAIVPIIMEEFFFEHMVSTYGVQWVVMHVVHGVFKAVEKYRRTIPTVELFYCGLIATMDDSSWRYIQQCRALLQPVLAEVISAEASAESIGDQQLRSCIVTLYDDMTEHEIEETIERYRLFRDEYRHSRQAMSPQSAPYLTAGYLATLDQDAFFEFVTHSLMDGTEHRYSKVRAMAGSPVASHIINALALYGYANLCRWYAV
jgi:hypothetical protein